MLVRLTAEGKAAVDGAFEALLDAERLLLADLPAGRARRGSAGLLRTPARAVRLSPRVGARLLEQLGGLEPLQLELVLLGARAASSSALSSASCS